MNFGTRLNEIFAKRAAQPKTEPTKFCVNCAHHAFKNSRHACRRHGQWTHAVTGEKFFHWTECELDRATSAVSACGVDAKFFQPKQTN